MIVVPHLAPWAARAWEWRRMSPWQRFPRAFALLDEWGRDDELEVDTVYADDLRPRSPPEPAGETWRYLALGFAIGLGLVAVAVAVLAAV